MSSWIKMNTSLRDNPKVDLIACELDTTEAEVLGALFILWSVADSQTEDGHLEGMNIKMIDRKTGVNGFGNALALSGWLVEDVNGVTLPDFGEHNGATAKKRSSTAKRQASFKSKTKVDETARATKGSEMSNAPALPAGDAGALPREEKIREEKSKNTIHQQADKKSIFPKGILSKSIAIQKRTKVLEQMPIMARIGKWFNRQENTLWNVDEAKALRDVNPSAEELNKLELYYSDRSGDKPLRKSIDTLLNNWSGEVDRANTYDSDSKPTSPAHHKTEYVKSL